MRLLDAAMASRDYELGREEIRTDLLEFASFVLLCEMSGQSLARPPELQPFTLALVGLGQRYKDPKILRDLAQLVRAGAPL